MRSSVFWALVRKDLYLMRGFMIATIATGVMCAVLMELGKTAAAVGGVLFLTADIASGIFIAMYSLVAERKAQSRMFALSLPISGYRHDLAKLVSCYLSYGIPWLIITGLALGVFLLPHMGHERGMVVYVLVLQVFVLALFGVIFAALFVASNETMPALVILIVNIGFSLFVVELNQPRISGPLHGVSIVWTPFAMAALAASSLVVALALTFSMILMSRRRDYI